jgi:integrase/recombinase XerD
MVAEEIGQFQLHLLREKKLALGTIALRIGALRFLYKKTLKRRDLDFDDLPLLRAPKKLPVVLSPEEVTRLIEAAPNLLYRTLLMLLYATGLRRAEAANLKVSDIDSSRMLIHVHQGKGSRDRELPLTQKLLGALRDYWRAAKMKPRVYLFASRRGPATQEQPISDKTVWHACHEAALRAGMGKRIGPHTLRHSSRPTCWKPARTCAPSSCCWDTGTSRTPRCICIYRAATSALPPIDTQSVTSSWSAMAPTMRRRT